MAMSKKRPDRKGQITVFMIIGVVILMSFVLAYFLKAKVAEKDMEAETEIMIEEVYDVDTKEVPEQIPDIEPEPVPAVEEEIVPVARCNYVKDSYLTTVFGGKWETSTWCPRHPPMPKGVDVCQCSFDNSIDTYIDIETQLYLDKNETERVFNMYCSEDDNNAGDASCKAKIQAAEGVKNTYFRKWNYFVKISCTGKECKQSDIDKIAWRIAERMDEEGPLIEG